jgi:hypothetical protein
MTVRLLEPTKPRADRRLAAVEARLLRRRRKDGRFLVPTAFDVGYGTTDERQRFAIYMLFRSACESVEHPHIVMTRRELESRREQLQATATALRDAACGPHILGDEPQLDPLITAAEEVEFEIERMDRQVTTVERDRGNLRDQAVVISIARVADLLFNRQMPGVVATLAGAVLGHEVSPGQVREWCGKIFCEGDRASRKIRRQKKRRPARS